MRVGNITAPRSRPLATIAGVGADDYPASGLEGVGLTLAYYAGK